MLILSSILLIIGAYNLCIVLIFVVLITLIFLIIRGKNKSKGIKEKKKQELINNHLSEVATKMKKIEHLREKLDTSQNTSHKSIKNIQKSRWNDGSPTQKEIIEGFNK
jgi:ABC-type bacteriocin/lantibiotic exporter with double-glycine peptidase domain